MCDEPGQSVGVRKRENLMEHAEETTNAASTSQSGQEPSHKQQAQLDARILTLLEQCKAEIQNAEQRLAEVQTQFELTQLRFSALQEALANRAATAPQTEVVESSFPVSTQEHEGQTVVEPVYPTYGLYAYGCIENDSFHFDLPGIDKKHKVYPIEGRELSIVVSKINISQFQEQVKNLYAALSQTPGAVQNQSGVILQD